MYCCAIVVGVNRRVYKRIGMMLLMHAPFRCIVSAACLCYAAGFDYDDLLPATLKQVNQCCTTLTNKQESVSSGLPPLEALVMIAEKRKLFISFQGSVQVWHFIAGLHSS